MRLGVGPLGVVFLLSAVLPMADGSTRPADAQTAAKQRKAPAAKSKAPAATDTDRVLDGAAKSLAEGNADAAMTSLDGLLSGGKLANNHMARALYLRGVAHRKKGRPAQAIADLTSAVWLKDGLGDADRTAALRERAEVSKEVGVADAGPPPSAAPAAAAAPATPARPAPSAPTGLVTRPPAQGAPNLSEGGFPRITSSTPSRTATAPPPAAQPEPAPSAPPAQRAAQAAPTAPAGIVSRPPPVGAPNLSEGGFPSVSSSPAPPARENAPRQRTASVGKATSSWQSGTSVETEGRRDGWVTVDERQKSAAPPPDRPPASGGGVGDFLSGLFGGSPSSSPPQRPVRSADASPWAAATRDAPAPARKPPERSSPLATSAVPQAGEAQGAYRLQIAAVRSRTEAEAVAARVKKEHGKTIGTRKVDIDQTVFGNMGTFYRVRLGPYAAASEPKLLCDELRTKGYDCLVVNQ